MVGTNQFVKLKISFFVLFLTACQTKSIHNTGTIKPQVIPSPTQTASPTVPNTPVETRDYVLTEEPEKESAPQSSQPYEPQNSNFAKLPKIGLILGPGGAKTFAHIGVLQEFQKAKIPVSAVAGLEFAAPMAALFAWKGFVNDVEWQMSKIKDDEIVKKGLISSSTKPANMTDVRDFLKTVFHNLKVESLKKPFGCPALNLSKNQIYMMSRGSLEQLLPYCWPYPPLFKAYKNNVSGLRDLKLTSDFLRSQGAQYVILVNVLGGNMQKHPAGGSSDSLENLSWTELATSYARPQAGVDAMISLNLEDYGIMDLSQKREIMQKGADLSVKQIEVLSQRLGY